MEVASESIELDRFDVEYRVCGSTKRAIVTLYVEPSLSGDLTIYSAVLCRNDDPSKCDMLPVIRAVLSSGLHNQWTQRQTLDKK